jgi:tetratricopeptide (TPR) repeat protein
LKIAAGLLLASAGLCWSATTVPVKVWLDKLTIPVSEEGPPDPNPPFDVFTATRFSYPYTLRTSLTGRTVTRDLRAVYLENEYLKCSVLPDLGGHLYSCTDKISGKEMFYANPSLKKQLIGYRGVWAAYGIEFNFPVSHNWMSVSPVDFAYGRNPADGSASVTVGNIDRPYGMQWRVELVLRPASTVLEQKVTLYNPGDVRRRYYWWNNAGVEVGDDSHIYYPMRFTASHGFTHVDTWPVNQKGLDLAVVKNQVDGPVSAFVHGSREPFMGVWHPRSNSGVAHYAEYADLPGKKIWSWGVDPDGLDWRKALSDNNSAYVEVQAGLYRNQETYSFLPPQGTIRFSEYWMPVRALGGISRANPHGVVFMARDGGKLRVALNVNHAVTGAQVRVLDGDRVLAEVKQTLGPRTTFTREIDGAPADRKCTFELRDASGAVLLAHTEDTYDWAPESEMHVGPQAPVSAQNNPIELGAHQELDGALMLAMNTYDRALQATPESYDLNKAAGRLAVTLKNYTRAVELLKRAQAHLTSDAEIHYYLGHAYLGLGDPRHARAEFEGAQRQPGLRAAALLQLAQLDSAAGHRAEALALIAKALEERPGMVRAGGMEVALLRTAGKKVQANERAVFWLKQDPTSSFLRNERVKTGGAAADADLWRHLAADPERVVEIAVQYMNLGLWADALELLARRYPEVNSDEAEPGTPLPQNYPVIAYYRGYCREKLGQSGIEDYNAAAQLPTAYVFPNRPTTLAVLRHVAEQKPQDAIAHFLLGSLYLSGGMVDPAISEWQTARSIKRDIPVLDRNLGRTLLTLKHDDAAAADVFREGLDADTRNVELYAGLTQALSLMGRPAAERVAVLERYPDRAHMPTSLAIDLALSYAEVGRFQDSERMFHDRYFEREEGGANIREVYLEVRMMEALALARGGKGAEARQIVDNLPRPAAGLDFTRDGLQVFLSNARFEFYRGQLERVLGDESAARAHWTKAAAGHGVFAALAAKSAGDASWEQRATRLAELPRGGSFDRGAALLALGRSDEGRRALADCLRAPDHNLVHYLARRALSGN